MMRLTCYSILHIMLVRQSVLLTANSAPKTCDDLLVILTFYSCELMSNKMTCATQVYAFENSGCPDVELPVG